VPAELAGETHGNGYRRPYTYVSRVAADCVEGGGAEGSAPRSTGTAPMRFLFLTAGMFAATAAAAALSSRAYRSFPSNKPFITCTTADGLYGLLKKIAFGTSAARLMAWPLA
jgi:hypothetical protein